MTDQPEADNEYNRIRAFVDVAREFCDFVESASMADSIAERLATGRRLLARLVAAGSALPLVEATSDKNPLSRAASVGWPRFGPHDYCRELDPYADEEKVAGSLSDDVLYIYRDLKRGLAILHAGQTQDAVWLWRFHFDHHWGERAVDALRALHRACTATADSASNPLPGDRPRVIVKTGGLVEETKISIGVHGPDVDPPAISQLLGVDATSQHRAGERRQSGPPWREGAWLFTVEGKVPRGPEEVAEEFLAALPPCDSSVWESLRSKYRLLLKVAVFFDGWNRGFKMGDDVIRRLAGLSGSIDFDIYAG